MTATAKRGYFRKFDVDETTDRQIDETAELRGITAAGLFRQSLLEYFVNHEQEHDRIRAMRERSRMGPNRAC